MGEINIITTSDGSHTLFHTTLNETYHSVHGAIQESQHVFIRQGLDFCIAKNPPRDIRILEVGFGTGLNVLLTLLHSQSLPIKIYYESWEAYPLDPSLIQQLNYGELLGDKELFSKIHDVSWGQSIKITATFTLHKHQGDLQRDSLITPFDLVYYDAFAPTKQSEMWTYEILKKITEVLPPGGVWVTYCAKGQVKRDLLALGLKVETLSGPPGKKEMIRASK